MSTVNPGDTGTRMELPPWDIHCEHCWQSYPIPDKRALAVAYFTRNIRLRCQDCGELIDWWASTLKSIRKTEVSTIHEICLPIGARMTIIETDLLPNRVTEIGFVQCGIPSDVLILNLNYNAVCYGVLTEGSASIEAVEIYENPLFRRVDSKGARFLGVTHGQSPYPDTKIHITVTWAPNNADDESSQNLTNAFLYYVDNRFHGAVIAANAAVEARLSKLIGQFLNSVVPSKGNVEGFLRDAATYGHSLNVLLPALLSYTKAPPLADHLRGALNRVKTLRNNLAHGNITYDRVSEDDAAQALCAAVFGLHYLGVIEPFLFKKLRKEERKKRIKQSN